MGFFKDTFKSISNAGSGIVGGALGLASSAFQAKQQSDEATYNRKWQAQMSNTAHQREVADLRAAGLNPILSAGGSGASTPGGSLAQTTGLADGLSKGVSSALVASQVPQAKFQARLATDTMRWYDDNPLYRTVMQGANAAKMVGLPPEWGAMGGFFNGNSEPNSGWSLKDYLDKPFPGKLGDSAQKPKAYPPLRKDLQKGEKWTPYGDEFFNIYKKR